MLHHPTPVWARPRHNFRPWLFFLSLAVGAAAGLAAGFFLQ
jgi:hypothetical protein